MRICRGEATFTERLIPTERLDLVAASLAHVEAELAGEDALAALLGVSVPEGWPPGEYDRGALEYFRAQLQAGGPDAVGWYGWYAIARGADGARIGLVAAAGYLGPPRDGVVEVGYSVVPHARRQGYATEIVSALVAHAFEEPAVREIIAHTSDENVASTRVLRACGFEAVGPGTEPGSIRFRTRRGALA